jgi:hypothetical protein
MSRDLVGIRPAVISQTSAEGIDEFRRFRHLVRNAYAIDLVPEKMAGLMAALPAVWPGLRAELMAFADFLDALGTATKT